MQIRTPSSRVSKIDESTLGQIEVTGQNLPEALRRRVPKVADLAPLLRFVPPALTNESRVAKTVDIHDLRKLARRRVPRGPFDYVDGGSEEEVTLDRARQAFRDLEFRPQILRASISPDLSTQILGKRSALPFGIAPTGFTRMLHSAGEYAGSAAAAKAGIPFTLSIMGTASIEDVAATAPTGRNWFQHVLWTDRGRALELIERVKAAGYDTLFVDVDIPVGGERRRDLRNGMSVPPSLTVKTVLDASYRPAWWFNFLTHEPLGFSSLSRSSGTVTELMNSMFEPAVGPQDLSWLRENWKGKLMVKGIQTLTGAREVVQLGADGIVLSNHGGRQLDRAPIPLHLLPEVASELKGKAAIMLDTGIMNGGDIVASLALGADFVLIGRAYLYGLMAGGQQGVERSIEILQRQIARTMTMLGVSSVAELGPEHVKLLKNGRERVPRAKSRAI